MVFPRDPLAVVLGLPDPSHKYTALSGHSSSDLEYVYPDIQLPLQARRQGKVPELCANLRRSDPGCNEPRGFGRRSSCLAHLLRKRIHRYKP